MCKNSSTGSLSSLLVSIYKPFFLYETMYSSREKGWGHQAGNQSKKPQQICALTVFQNGGFALPKVFITEGETTKSI